MDIREQLKKIISDKGLTYREVGALCGWSGQNVWIKLNEVDCPNYETVARILRAIGMNIRIDAVEQPVILDPDARALQIEDITKDQQVSFEVVEQLAKSLGYDLIIE